jgi:ferric-dicitrate binding protein FerR (iron transport regulator)
MRTRSYFCTALSLLVVFCTSATQQLQSPQTASLPVGSATISEIKGAVVLQGPQGEALTPSRGLILSAESTIETAKGSLLLVLQDGSQVLVKSHSRVVLKAPDRDKGFSLELLIGKVLNKIKKRLGNTPSFRMGTPTAVITVRGTRFEVEVNKKLRTAVVVYDGLVEVQGLLGNTPPVFVRPGFVTDVDRDRAPSNPRRFLDSGEDNVGRPSGGFERGDQQGQRQGERDSPSDRSGPDD